MSSFVTIETILTGTILGNSDYHHPNDAVNVRADFSTLGSITDEVQSYLERKCVLPQNGKVCVAFEDLKLRVYPGEYSAVRAKQAGDRVSFYVTLEVEYTLGDGVAFVRCVRLVR